MKIKTILRKALFVCLAFTALIIFVLPRWARHVGDFDLGVYQYLAYGICLVLPFMILLIKKTKGKDLLVFSLVTSVFGFYSSITMFTAYCVINKTTPQEASDTYLFLVVLLVTYFSFELPWFLRTLRAKKSITFLFVLLFFVVTENAESKTPAPQIKGLFKKYFPGGKLLVQTECDMGNPLLKSFGLLVQLKAPKSEQFLVAAVAVKLKEEWTMTALPKELKYQHGGDQNFLSDFWNSKTGFKGAYEIRCTTPNMDKDITTKANGEFAGSFSGKEQTSGKHLCFQASDFYNSWACFNFNVASGKVEPSFSQMNAD